MTEENRLEEIIKRLEHLEDIHMIHQDRQITHIFEAFFLALDANGIVLPTEIIFPAPGPFHTDRSSTYIFRDSEIQLKISIP